LSNPIEYLKGVGPLKGDLLKKELGIFTFKDLLEHFPFRHVDKTQVNLINEMRPESDYIQVAGKIISFEVIGQKFSKRAVAIVKDKTGELELVWFQGVSWIQKMVEVGMPYLVYGKVSFFQGKPQLSHPEIELLTNEKKDGKSFLEPVYPSTEKLKAKGLGGRQIAKLTEVLMKMVSEKDIPENIPAPVINQLKLPSRFEALTKIHFPKSPGDFELAASRIKFEELFVAQLRIMQLRSNRHRYSKGVLFEKVGDLFNNFYKNYLPFELTNAQKRVLKEIRTDTARGHQMNRLLQGDVGSGKTVVALLTMLLAADNGFQSCLMAPTEILAQQHLTSIKKMLKDLPVNVELLTGSAKAKERKRITQLLVDGSLHILIGTHAVIEEVVQFKNLGLVIVDEQHRFGVAQRAKLWEKAETAPHVLVMTATPKNTCYDSIW